MKLSAGLNILNTRNIDKLLSKKITLANTADRLIDKKAQQQAVGSPSDPLYFTNGQFTQPFNPDIRYRTDFAYSPLTGINYRNDLLVFSENIEVKKAVGIVGNETVILDTEISKYPVFPKLEMMFVEEVKKKTADAIQDYLDKYFYPKMWQWYHFKDDGLINLVKEFLKTGKICYEIIYDSLQHPKEIIGFQPLDPSTLQKFKIDDKIYYVQRPIFGVGAEATGERILHENQVILCEWNEYDFGYISYVDGLRRPFNVMRSMQTSKILWFAAKSQVRMHIKLAMGDVSRPEAIQKLTESKNQYINQFSFEDSDGIVRFNNKPNNNGYREFFTAETAGSGSPEIEEINANGPDLTETDSLSFWAKQYWMSSEIPFDRIDPNASETWGFTDVNSLRKIEVNFGKFINGIRKMLNPLFIKPITIQLTLQEAEIGVDLSLLDTIKMQWNAFNEYDKLAELEVMNKKIELAQNIANFGEYTDASGNSRKAVPLMWIVKTFLDLSQEQLESMERERIRENLMLGFNADGSNPNEEGSEEDKENYEDEDETETDTELTDNEDNETTVESDDISIVDLVKAGKISEDELKILIDAEELSEEEIEELKEAGLYPEETPEEIANEDDSNFE